MVERLLLVVVLGAVVVLATLAVQRYSARRAMRVMAAPVEPLWQSLGERPDGRRTLVAFSTPSCAACHHAQAPAIRSVEQQLGAEALRVIRVDAAERPEVARAFGVMTVPSTVVLAEAGRVLAVNQGFAPSVKLVKQLQSA